MIETMRDTRQIVIDQMLKGIHMPENSRVLEPSAGYGDLVNGILEKFDVTVDCIELNVERYHCLIMQGFNALHADFLQVQPKRIYDFVVAAPTYKDDADLYHIMHMYHFLKPGGEIISLTHPSWTVGDVSIQSHFRAWLSDKEYSLRMLTDFSFIEDYKTQPSMILHLKRDTK